MKNTSQPCRVHYVYPDRTEYHGMAIGAPSMLADAAYDAGAIGVTVVVLA